MDLKTKLQIIVALSIAVIVLAGVILVVSLQRETVASNGSSLAQSIAQNSMEQSIVADQYLLYHEDSAKEQWRLKQREIDGLLTTAQNQFSSADSISLIENLSASQQNIETIFPQLTSGASASTSTVTTEFQKRLAGQLLINSQHEISSAFALSSLRRDVITNAQETAAYATGAAFLGLALLITSLLILFQQKIVRPLEVLDRAAQGVGRGDFDQKIDIAGTDEIGRLGSSFKNMIARLKESIVLLRKEVEATSAERNKLALVLSGINDAVIALDQQRTIVLFNTAAVALTNIPAAEALGKSIESIFHLYIEENEVPPEQYCDRTKAKDDGIIFSGNLLTLVSAGGVEKEVAVISGTIKEQTDLESIITLHDLSKERIADRAKARFITVAAHQLRTPLTAIKWGLQEIMEGAQKKLNKNDFEVLAESFEAANELTVITDDILNVSQIENGTFQYSFAKHPLRDLLETIAEHSRIKMGKKKLQFSIDIAQDLGDAVFDSEKLTMALNGLVDNAVEYTPENGSVSLSAMRQGEQIKITITDTGIGFSPADRENMFTKFYRGSGAIHVRPNGSGLGLYLAREIVTGHGGSIDISSPGTGALVTVTLPREQAHTAGTSSR